MLQAQRITFKVWQERDGVQISGEEDDKWLRYKVNLT
jgi:hypothetical protein